MPTFPLPNAVNAVTGDPLAACSTSFIAADELPYRFDNTVVVEPVLS